MKQKKETKNKNITRKTHIIDATNKSVGRLAEEVAKLLRGKNKIDFSPNKDNGDFVVVKNFLKIKILERKMKREVHYHHTGYPGGLKSVTLDKMFKENPERLLRNAVLGMLPKNKLRAAQIKRLKIEK